MLLEYYKHPWDFELLDTGNGYRLERWGQAVLARPDPQIIWQKSLPKENWEKADAIFVLGKGEEKGKWQTKNKIPNMWTINFGKTKFLLKLSPFKHTGLFAEQAVQWDWMKSKLSSSSSYKVKSLETLNFPSDNFKLANKFKVLNLFAYTGGATMVLAKAGCQVTHVDASKPSITWAHENHKLNNLPEDSVRWILDDAVKFVKRELKRGAKYDGIIMDPPAFGHSPSGKTWKFNQDLPGLLKDSVDLLSESPKFLIINGYATNSSALSLNNLLAGAIKHKNGAIEFGELCLSQPTGNQGSRETKNSERLISTGIFARWSK